MKQTQLFTKTRREAPRGEESKNAQLLIRGGFVHKEMAGVYTWLPLGLRVLNNINTIIREEMNAVGGQEVLMTALQDPSIWKASHRWESGDVDVWFKTQLQAGGETGLGFTHEEPLTRLMRDHVRSYKDLPAYPYQIQWKFRNEQRAKSGVMRGREFLMKDMYSFSKDAAEHETFYENSKDAYMNVYKRLGIGDKTYVTFASGGSFSKFSHEFQTVCDQGEDTIYIDKEKNIAVNEEVYTDEVLRDLGLDKGKLVEEPAVEVGNIFSLGTRFSEALDLTYVDESGEKKHPVMGSYGIGPSRLVGALVEILSDEKGMMWPEEVTPYTVHLLSFDKNDEAEEMYDELRSAGIEVLYDDRDARPGEKLADADLIGCTYRVVVSDKSLQQGGAELKKRTEEESSIVSTDELINTMQV